MIDLHYYGGALLLSVGAGWAWPPAGLMVGGASLIALFVLVISPKGGR